MIHPSTYTTAVLPIPNEVFVCTQADCARRHQFKTNHCYVCGGRCVPERVELDHVAKVRVVEHDRLAAMAKGGGS